MFADSLAKALASQGVDVERADSTSAAATADVLLPDLIVLAADAAHSRGERVLAQLQKAGRRTAALVICAATTGPAAAPHVAYAQEGNANDCAAQVRGLLSALVEGQSATLSLQQRLDQLARPGKASAARPKSDLPRVGKKTLVGMPAQPSVPPAADTPQPTAAAATITPAKAAPATQPKLSLPAKPPTGAAAASAGIPPAKPPAAAAQPPAVPATQPKINLPAKPAGAAPQPPAAPATQPKISLPAKPAPPAQPPATPAKPAGAAPQSPTATAGIPLAKAPQPPAAPANIPAKTTAAAAQPPAVPAGNPPAKPAAAAPQPPAAPTTQPKIALPAKPAAAAPQPPAAPTTQPKIALPAKPAAAASQPPAAPTTQPKIGLPAKPAAAAPQPRAASMPAKAATSAVLAQSASKPEANERTVHQTETVRPAKPVQDETVRPTRPNPETAVASVLNETVRPLPATEEPNETARPNQPLKPAAHAPLISFKPADERPTPATGNTPPQRSAAPNLRTSAAAQPRAIQGTLAGFTPPSDPAPAAAEAAQAPQPQQRDSLRASVLEIDIPMSEPPAPRAHLASKLQPTSSTHPTGPNVINLTSSRAPKLPLDPSPRATGTHAAMSGTPALPSRAPRLPFDPAPQSNAAAPRTSDRALSPSAAPSGAPSRAPRHPFDPAPPATPSTPARPPSLTPSGAPRYPFDPAPRTAEPTPSLRARRAAPQPIAAREYTADPATVSLRTRTYPADTATVTLPSAAQTFPEAPLQSEPKPQRVRAVWIVGALAAIGCTAFWLYKNFDANANTMRGNPAAASLAQTPTLAPAEETVTPTPIKTLQPSAAATSGLTNEAPGTAPSGSSRGSIRRAEPAAEAPDLSTRTGRAKALVDEGAAMSRQGRLGLAEGKYMKALQEVPEFPAALAELVRVHLARRDGIEAVRWAERLVSQQDNALHQLLLGDAMALRGNSDAAEAAWTKSARGGNATAKKRLADRADEE